MTDLADLGPVLTPAEAAAFHDRREPVVWFVQPAPDGHGMIARAHTETHNGGQLLPGHLSAADLEGLRAILPPGLQYDGGPSAGSPPGCSEWWWP